jgi:hypothetical protein
MKNNKGIYFFNREDGIGREAGNENWRKEK